MSWAQWALRLMGPLIFILFGLDQLKNTGEWLEYIPEWMKPRLPGGATGFMRLHAVLNVILGVWILSGVYLKLAAGLAVLWMVTIVGVSYLSGKWRVAARDLSITLGLIALFLLT